MGTMKGRFQNPCSLGWACLVFLIFLIPSMRAQDTKCQRVFIIDDMSVVMEHCKHVGNLGSTLSWRYEAEKGTILAAFKAKPVTSRGWVAWGLNPSGKGFVGAEVLVAQRLPNGSMFTGIYKGVSQTGPSSSVVLTRIDYSGLFQSEFSVYHHDNLYIYARVVLPSNKTTVNQAWQVGSPSKGGLGAFLVSDPQSFGTIDLLRGKLDPSPPSPSDPSPSPSSPLPPPPPPPIKPPSPSPKPPSPFVPSPSPSTPNPPTPSTPSPSPNTPNPPPSTPSPSPSTPNPPPLSSPSPNVPNPPSSLTPTPSTSPPPFPSPSPSTPPFTPTPTNPFPPTPSPTISSGTNNDIFHATISAISLSFISLFTVFACTMFSTM